VRRERILLNSMNWRNGANNEARKRLASPPTNTSTHVAAQTKVGVKASSNRSQLVGEKKKGNIRHEDGLTGKCR